MRCRGRGRKEGLAGVCSRHLLPSPLHMEALRGEVPLQQPGLLSCRVRAHQLDDRCAQVCLPKQQLALDCSASSDSIVQHLTCPVQSVIEEDRCRPALFED